MREARVHRFRPIRLTSLTTFFPLAPLMSNQSFDAASMVPLAVSLGFGVLFATFITLILVPTFYMLLDDLGQRTREIFHRREASVATLTGPSAAPIRHSGPQEIRQTPTFSTTRHL